MEQYKWNPTQTNKHCFFFCPNQQGKTAEVSSNKAFQLNNLDNNIKCNFCQNISDNKDWECTCDNKWYQCIIHHNYGPTCIHTKDVISQDSPPDLDIQPHTQPPKRLRRANKFSEYEAILADDTRIANRKRMSEQALASDKQNDLVDLGRPRHLKKKPRLGPILNNRICRSLVNGSSLTRPRAVRAGNLQSA